MKVEERILRIVLLTPQKPFFLEKSTPEASEKEILEEINFKNAQKKTRNSSKKKDSIVIKIVFHSCV